MMFNSFQINRFLSKIKASTGLDWASSYATLGNISSFLIGPVTAYLITVYFSPELQGYYYTFGSIITLRFFAEVGLGQAIIQFASHEWANLNLNNEGKILGSPASKSRLAGLARNLLQVVQCCIIYSGNWFDIHWFRIIFKC